MNKWWASDYNSFEKILYLRDRILTPSGYNRSNYGPVLSHRWSAPELQNESTGKFSIALLGDLMPLKGKELVLSEEIKSILQSVDLIVVNLEGIITKERRYLALSHDPDILDLIDELSLKAVKVINVANNHAGDFGEDEFLRSIERIGKYGFPVLGYDNSSNIQIDKVNLYSSSYWSNQEFRNINRFTYKGFEDINTRALKGYFNLFLPHWGYEMQLYPTTKQKIFTRQLKSWDLIVGNHPHCPQPIERLKGDKNRFAAYSLGNFCYSHYNPNHYGGSILKVSIDNGIEPKLLGYDFHLTNMDISNKRIVLRQTTNLEYGKLRRTKLWLAGRSGLSPFLKKAQ